jgi:creatinine amidohydrolase
VERQLQKLSFLTVRELVPAKVDTIILPVGTVEAHGSACIGTDNFIPEIIANGVAERLNALVAPTVNYGITRSLYRYNGGSTIQPEIFGRYIQDILLSFADHGFKNIVVMNGHGGNNSALKSTAIDVHNARRVNIAVIHWWELCAKMTEEFFGHAGGHAGTDENAMVMSLDSSLVGQEKYSPDLAFTFRPGADIYPVPGTILLYKENEGYPEFDRTKAIAYRDKVVAHVGEFVEGVLSQWKRLGLG